jgi:hypothetical protein
MRIAVFLVILYAGLECYIFAPRGLAERGDGFYS